MLSKEAKILILIGALVLLPKKQPGGGNFIPRGFRNNNPGNIKISPNNWLGKVPISENTDGTFEQFEGFEYGLRAMMKLLSNYIASGDNTLTRIISRWAPSTENNTMSYINAISQKTGIAQSQQISFPGYTLVNAMVEHENGNGWTITAAQYEQAKKML